MNFLAIALLVAASPEPFYTYIGRLGTDSFLLAWGTRDAIGRESASLGEATVRVDGRELKSTRNWIEVGGLRPDETYAYAVQVGDRRAEGRVRTHPVQAERLSFLVIGDYGTGQPEQYELARAMARVVTEKADTESPVRFVLTTGDNIYAKRILLLFLSRTGSKDKHWEKTFFEPYREILGSVPFYPSPGNHDGDESEDAGDLVQYLDNFFFPGPPPLPTRYYHFNFGGLADFFALDSTRNAPPGGELIYKRGGKQSLWLEEELRAARARWKIPYFHHPPFTAGPRHEPSESELAHFLTAFETHGVAVVFSGHEHNLQVSERNKGTGDVRYVVTGAGGELRTGTPKRFTFKGTSAPKLLAGWARELHFLLVEIDGSRMRVSPLTFGGRMVKLEPGAKAALPFEIVLDDWH